MKLIDGGVIEETKQALKNLGYILDEAGSSYDNIIKTTLYLEDMDDFVNVNEIYKESNLIIAISNRLLINFLIT